MKKISFIFVVIISIMASCKKDEMEMIAKPPSSTSDSSALVYWDDLPEEYKNATPVERDETGNEDKITRRNSYEQDEVFNPFNISTANFSINIPAGYVIKKVGMGQSKNGTVSYLTIWYTTGQNNSLLYVASSGGNTSNPMTTRNFSTGEYIRGFQGRVNQGILTNLIIYTNYAVLRGTEGIGGTAFAFFASPGSYIGTFSGNVGAAVNQIKTTSYFLPWRQVSRGNAREVAIAANGTSYMADAAGLLYQMASSATAWTTIPGAPAGVYRIAAHNTVLYVATIKGKIYQHINTQWKEVAGAAETKDIAVSNSGKLFAILGSSQDLYTLINGGWSKLTSIQPLANVALYDDADAKVVNSGGAIQGLSQDYNNGLSVPLGSGIKDITITSWDEIWTTTNTGKVKVRNGGVWKETAGTNALRIDGIPGTLIMANVDGGVYSLNY